MECAVQPPDAAANVFVGFRSRRDDVYDGNVVVGLLQVGLERSQSVHGPRVPMGLRGLVSVATNPEAGLARVRGEKADLWVRKMVDVGIDVQGMRSWEARVLAVSGHCHIRGSRRWGCRGRR